MEKARVNELIRLTYLYKKDSGYCSIIEVESFNSWGHIADRPRGKTQHFVPFLLACARGGALSSGIGNPSFRNN